MSEATGGGRAEMERRLKERSLADDAFRQRLLADPKAAVEQEIGTSLPEEVRVVAVEETPDTIYLVLPLVSTDAQEVGELSDRELETVAGVARKICKNARVTSVDEPTASLDVATLCDDQPEGTIVEARRTSRQWPARRQARSPSCSRT